MFRFIFGRLTVPLALLMLACAVPFLAAGVYQVLGLAYPQHDGHLFLVPGIRILVGLLVLGIAVYLLTFRSFLEEQGR